MILSSMRLPLFELLLFKVGNIHLLADNLRLHFVFLLNPLPELLLSLLVKLSPLLYLPSLIPLAHKNGLRDFAFLIVPGLRKSVIFILILRDHALILFHMLNLTVQLHLIFCFQIQNVFCSLLGLLDFLPSSQLLLLQQSNSVREELCIAVDLLPTFLDLHQRPVHAVGGVCAVCRVGRALKFVARSLVGCHIFTVSVLFLFF